MSGAVDQADGLRRLLTAGRSRIIAVVGMSVGAGATTAAMNLCVSLGQQGKRVLLLDEHGCCPNTASSVWSVAPAGTLADVARQQINLDEAAAHVAQGVKLLPTPREMSNRPFNVRSLCPDGVIVIDVALDDEGRLSALARMADNVVVVMQPSAASITSTYAGLKQLQYTHALQTFQFLVNDVANVRQAQLVIANVMNTSSRFLAVSLRPIGSVSTDILVREAARLHRTVCEAYPTSAAATEFRRIATVLIQAGERGAEGGLPNPSLSAPALPGNSQ